MIHVWRTADLSFNPDQAAPGRMSKYQPTYNECQDLKLTKARTVHAVE